MSVELGTGRDYVEKQYADDRNLAARQSIYSYQRPQLDLHKRSLDLAELRGDETVLEIGCGNGRYLTVLHERGHRGVVAGGDLSQGILRTARPAFGGPLFLADAQALPFSTASADVVLAMHMMYHVPDRARALAEIRRVVRAGGRALVLTNSVTHFQELDDLLNECATATVGAKFVRSRPSHDLFTAESAPAELEAVFDEVTADAVASELVIDVADPVVAYARSMGAFVVDDDRVDDREAVIVELERRLSEIIATDAAFRVTTACTTFVCR